MASGHGQPGKALRERTERRMNQDHRPGRTQTQVDQDFDRTFQRLLDQEINGQCHNGTRLVFYGSMDSDKRMDVSALYDATDSMGNDTWL
eukprot:6415856-Amphidinium_carterae.1